MGALSQVAETIVAQLGGTRRLAMFLGVKFLVSRTDGLGFRFAAKSRARVNHCDIELRGDDTYTVKFYQVAGATANLKAKEDGVYAEDLIPLFERSTGLYLHF